MSGIATASAPAPAERARKLLAHGLAHHRAGRADQAAAAYRELLAADPGHADALNLLGVIALQGGDPAAAEALIRRALAVRPSVADYHSNLGEALRGQGRLDDAVDELRAAVACDPDHDDAFGNLGLIALAQGDLAGACEHFRAAIARDPGPARRHADLGRALLAAGSAGDAAAAFDQAIARAPDDVEALRLHALACRRAGRMADAVASLYRAAELAPSDGAVCADLGRALHEGGDLDGAIAAYRQALADDPDQADVHNNLGVALVESGAPRAALPHYRAALARAPSAETHNNMAMALHALGRLGEAERHFRHALTRDPKHPDVLNNFGNLCIEQGRISDGLALYQQALYADPDHDRALASLLSRASLVCDWSRQADLVRALRARLPDIARTPGRAASLVPLTFSLPYFCSDTDLIGEVCRLVGGHFARTARAPAQTRSPAGEDPERRLAIAYLSPDFGDHPIGHVTRPIYALHDRDRFEVTCYSTLDRSAAGDPYLADIRAGADHFVDLSRLAHADAAKVIAGDRIDILVDLCGYMRHGRPQVLAQRPAPLQLYWQGHSGSLGAPYIDYMIGDPVVTPAAEDDRFTEAVIRLADGFSCADRHAIADVPGTRAAHGLAADAVVLCAFNNPLKIEAGTFAAWMEILAAVPDAVLWLSAPADTATTDNLEAAAAQAGIEPARLVFAPRVPDKSRHLARHRLADLFLDTFLFNASTTALDALWAGLPTLTRRGGYATQRLCASYLTTLGLDELIAPDTASYVATAIGLARDAGARRRLKETLAERRLSRPLFDAPRFTRQLEAAYRAAWRRRCAGLVPTSFDVEATG